MDRSSPNKKSKFQLEPPPTLAVDQVQGLADQTLTTELVKERSRPRFNLTVPDMLVFDREPKPVVEKAPIVTQPVAGDTEGFLSLFAQAHAAPYGKTFEELGRNLEQAWTSTGHVSEAVSGLLLGEWLSNPERVYAAFASGDKGKMREALSGLSEDLTLQVFEAMTLKMGHMARGIKPGLKLIQESLDRITPRQAMQQVNKVMPGFISSRMHSAWEVISSPVQRGVHKAVSARVFPSFEGRKSLADVFQPAVERLESTGLDVPFRRTSALKAIASERGKELGATLANMPLKGRYEVYKYLRGLPIKGTEKKMLEDWKHSFISGGMEREFVHSFRKTLKPKMKDEFLLGEDAFFNLPSAENFIRTLDQSLTGPFNSKKVQKALRGAIEDVNTPQELKFLARDLYNLPQSTPSAVAAASKDASVAFLTNNLKRMGVVRDTLPQGAKLGDDWWISKFPKLKDSYVPRDVELELRAVMDIPKLMSGNGVLAKMNRMLLSPWKTSKLILMPAAHFRNTMSNFVLNDWGGLPFYRMDVYMRAAREMKSKGKLFRELQRETGMGGSFSVAEIEQMTGGLKYGANGLDHALSLFDQMTSVPRWLYNAEEQWFKTAKYIWNREHHGMAPYEAAMDAMKWTFNYGEITRTTAAIRGTAAPFFTWTSKVIPLMAETAMKHPIRFAKWPLMFQAAQAAAIEYQDISDNEWQWLQSILPEYIKEGAFYLLPFRDSKDRLQMLNMTYIMPGLGDMSEILSGPATHFLGSPFLTMSADIMRNKTFMGTPLYYDWETPGAKFAKIMGHVWQGIVPNFPAIPGTIDFDKMYDLINNTPDSMTWGQMIASQFGLRNTPINPEQMARNRQALDDIHRSEIGSQMRRDLRKATSPKQLQAIVEHYSRVRERLERKVGERYE